MVYKSKYISLIMLVLLIVSAALTFVMSPLYRAAAQSSTPTATDMYTQGGSWAPWGTAFDSTGRVWVAMPGCDPSPMCGSTFPGQISVFNPQFNAWPVAYKFPAGFGQALFMAFDKQGRVWFPMPMSNSLGMFDPATNTFNQWAVPTAGAGPWDVAIDSKGGIWFTEHYVNKIGHFNPVTHAFTEIVTTLANTQPYGITVDASDNVWFTENNSAVARIGEYTAQGTLLEYLIRTGSTSGLTPHLITTSTNGTIWWSEGWTGRIGKLVVAAATPGTNNGVTEYAYQPTCGSCATHTSGIAIDKSGVVWFTDSLQSIFGSFTTSSSTFSLYNTPTANSHPHDGLNVDAHNTLWFTEEAANKLAYAQLTTGGGGVTPTATTGVKPSPTVAATPSPSATATPTSTPVAGATLGQDTFQRANQSFWGKSSDGQTWGGDANVVSSFSISGKLGVVANGSSSYSAVLGPTAANADVVFTSSISNFANNNFGAVLRWTDGNNWYKAYIDGTHLIIQKKVSGATTTLAAIPFVAAASTSYTIHFRAVGTTLTANVWNASASEPSGWMATATDSAFSSGFAGMRMQVLGGSTLSVSSFKAIALA